jgi:hypothetical protein
LTAVATASLVCFKDAKPQRRKGVLFGAAGAIDRLTGASRQKTLLCGFASLREKI